jgi:cell wall-associated NlpC family hydrolase
MLDCRALRPVLVLLAVLGLLCPALPASADKRHPTPAEVAAAQQRVRDARSAVQSLQVRAERAAEAYNGAHSQAMKATAARDVARRAAQAAQGRFVDAHVLATVARGQATAATAAAAAAEEASAQAALDAIDSQRQLDQIAAGAYRSGGQIGVLSQLMMAHDPVELANARNLMNRIGDHQQRVIDQMALAHLRSVRTAQVAARAKQAADTAAARATRVESAAASAKSEALATSQAASSSAHQADLLLSKANRARAAAQLLVTQAERALGRAVMSAEAMRKAAETARREAAGTQSGTAPSDAAATAIHWAFEEIGVPYSWGGGDEDGPTRGFAQGASTVGFDCSGLTLFIYHKAGIRLDHYTGSQWDQGRRVSSRSDLQPGDLMFFAFDTSDPSTIHHVAIYIGNNKLIEAPYTGAVVRVASADRSDYIGATRPWA